MERGVCCDDDIAQVLHNRARINADHLFAAVDQRNAAIEDVRKAKLVCQEEKAASSRRIAELEAGIEKMVSVNQALFKQVNRLKAQNSAARKKARTK